MSGVAVPRSSLYVTVLSKIEVLCTRSHLLYPASAVTALGQRVLVCLSRAVVPDFPLPITSARQGVAEFRSWRVVWRGRCLTARQNQARETPTRMPRQHVWLGRKSGRAVSGPDGFWAWLAHFRVGRPRMTRLCPPLLQFNRLNRRISCLGGVAVRH